MHAIMVESRRFLYEDRAEAFLKRYEDMQKEREALDEYDHGGGYHPMNGCYTYWISADHLTVYWTNYVEIQGYQLDGWFQANMNTMDNKLVQGAAKRTSKNGYDPALTDYYDEEEEY